MADADAYRLHAVVVAAAAAVTQRKDFENVRRRSAVAGVAAATEGVDHSAAASLVVGLRRRQKVSSQSTRTYQDAFCSWKKVVVSALFSFAGRFAGMQ